MFRHAAWILGVVAGVSATSVASAETIDRPRDELHWQPPTAAPLTPAGTVPYNTIYLNSCRPNGCLVRPGNPDGRADTWQINSQRTLTKFPYDDATWNAVVDCMKDTFSPFNVNITTTDPGNANHFEIMIAGSPTDLGMSNGIGGISPFSCSTYIDNSLVFDFAAVWQGSVEEMCSTAAQEIAHSFALDHTTVASDPLTYFPYSKRRYFQSAPEQCGSDCVNGRSPSGGTCTGTNLQNHPCACSNITGTMQNPTAIMTGLFGVGAPVVPNVKITKPLSGAAVQPGFSVIATATDVSGIDHVELRVDSALVLTVRTMPYVFNAPAMLTPGTHHVEVTAYNGHNVSSKNAIDVIIGQPCVKPADCPDATQTCVGGRCVAGPGTQGGLGSPCTMGTECASGNCSSDGTNSYCVESCTLGAGECPPSFGCLDAGNMMGLCWPGYDDGSGGGCATGTGGPISLGLVFAAFVMSRRRKK
ncbi:MAG: Carboxypeptidase regulatory-like protein [Myxococcales bacterium]|nr:Carboxypeptidase regulatory-like protein [Myxococcales bacterium]